MKSKPTFLIFIKYKWMLVVPIDIQAKENCRSVLNSLRKDNLDKLIFAHLSINSIRNKFNYLSEQIRGNVDILLVSDFGN